MTTTSKIVASVFSIALVAVASASAAKTVSFDHPLTFQELHTLDHNISAVEFAIIDANDDGLVDAAEYAGTDLENLDD